MDKNKWFRIFLVAILVAILVTSCAAPAPKDDWKLSEQIKSDLRTEMQGNYQSQIDSLTQELEGQKKASEDLKKEIEGLQKSNEELRQAIENLKSQMLSSSDLGGRVSALEAKVNAPAPFIQTSLVWRTIFIANELGWELDIRPCDTIAGLILEESPGECIKNFTGFKAVNGASGNFLVLAQIVVEGEYGIRLSDDIRYLLATNLTVPEDPWIELQSGEDQEEFQSILGWPSFEATGPGTYPYVLNVWPLSDEEYNILVNTGITQIK